MTPQDSFIARLRRHRERQGIPLADIAARTRVKLELLEAFERGDLTSWPRGLYARAWVRAYAAAIGVDPPHTVEEFCRLFPNGDRRAHALMEEIAAIVASASEYRDEFGYPADRRGAQPPLSVAPKPTWRDSIMRIVRSVRDVRNVRPAGTN